MLGEWSSIVMCLTTTLSLLGKKKNQSSLATSPGRKNIYTMPLDDIQAILDIMLGDDELLQPQPQEGGD